MGFGIFILLGVFLSFGLGFIGSVFRVFVEFLFCIL